MGGFVWESWITVKIWHQTEWNSFQTIHETPRRVASNTMRLSTTYPVCSFQSSVPVKFSFNTVFAATLLGNSYEREALATTEDIRGVWNIRCIIFSCTHIRWAAFQFQYLMAVFVWVCRTVDQRQARASTYTCSFGSGRDDRDLPESFRLALQKWTERRGFVNITMWLLLESGVCSLL